MPSARRRPHQSTCGPRAIVPGGRSCEKPAWSDGLYRRLAMAAWEGRPHREAGLPSATRETRGRHRRHAGPCGCVSRARRQTSGNRCALFAPATGERLASNDQDGAKPRWRRAIFEAAPRRGPLEIVLPRRGGRGASVGAFLGGNRQPRRVHSSPWRHDREQRRSSCRFPVRRAPAKSPDPRGVDGKWQSRRGLGSLPSCVDYDAHHNI